MTTALSDILDVGSPCSAYMNPKKKFAKRAQRGIIIAIGDGTKSYQVFLPKNRTVITMQHIRDIETLDKEQNDLLLRDEVDANTSITRRFSTKPV